MTGSLEWAILNSQPPDTQFESLSHSNCLLEGLNQLRSQGKLLDIKLEAEGETFQAHRVVLASCSDYFRAMFTDAMREAQQSEICLRGVTARGIELLINYAYTSKLELNLSNVQDILSAASHVQMDAVVSACSNYLETQIDLENCVDIATTAELYSLEKLKQKTYRFICSRLQEFSQTVEINRLQWEQLELILNCDYPVDCTELTVLQIVLRWILAQEADLKIIEKLLDQVRFTEIKSDELERLVRPFHMINSQIYNSVMSVATSQHKYSIKQNPKVSMPPGMINITAASHESAVLTNSRGMELALVKIGGFGTSGITNKITYYLPSKKKWHNLTVIPHVEQCNYGTAILGNDMYVVGGCYDVCLKEYIHPFGFRYCPTKNKWSTIAPMQQDRCRFSLNAVDHYLYAVGGASEFNENDEAWVQDVEVSNCERYNSRTDLWEYIPELPENRTQHAGAVHKKHLYVSGGLDRHRVLSSLWRFNTFFEKWEELRPMLIARADHVMLVIGDKIYVCGGWYEDRLTENRRLIETIDCYDIFENTWTVETTIPTPKYHAGIVAVNSQIYVIGGLHSDAMLDRASSTIDCYDIETKKWIVLDRYPNNIWECTCVTLYVPRCREDMEVIVDKDETASS